MSRSKWKVPYISNIFFSNFFKKNHMLNIRKRSSTIPSNFVNRAFRVHNGVWFLKINVKSAMVGHKFGEFSFTKRFGRSLKETKKTKRK